MECIYENVVMRKRKLWWGKEREGQGWKDRGKEIEGRRGRGEPSFEGTGVLRGCCFEQEQGCLGIIVLEYRCGNDYDVSADISRPLCKNVPINTLSLYLTILWHCMCSFFKKSTKRYSWL